MRGFDDRGGPKLWYSRSRDRNGREEESEGHGSGQGEMNLGCQHRFSSLGLYGTAFRDPVTQRGSLWGKEKKSKDDSTEKEECGRKRAEGEKGRRGAGHIQNLLFGGNQADDEMGFLSRVLKAAGVGSQSFARPRPRRPTFRFHKSRVRSMMPKFWAPRRKKHTAC